MIRSLGLQGLPLNSNVSPSDGGKSESTSPLTILPLIDVLGTALLALRAP